MATINLSQSILQKKENDIDKIFKWAFNIAFYIYATKIIICSTSILGLENLFKTVIWTLIETIFSDWEKCCYCPYGYLLSMKSKIQFSNPMNKIWNKKILLFKSRTI